jgi:hypothetical protein
MFTTVSTCFTQFEYKIRTYSNNGVEWDKADGYAVRIDNDMFLYLLDSCGGYGEVMINLFPETFEAKVFDPSPTLKPFVKSGATPLSFCWEALITLSDRTVRNIFVYIVFDEDYDVHLQNYTKDNTFIMKYLLEQTGFGFNDDSDSQ